jgi:hypothetical protein
VCISRKDFGVSPSLYHVKSLFEVLYPFFLLNIMMHNNSSVCLRKKIITYLLIRLFHKMRLCWN